MIPPGLIPPHGAAAVRVTAALHAHLIAIINHWGPGIGHHGQIREFHGARVAFGDGEEAGGVVAAEQIHLRGGDVPGIPGEELFEALGKLTRIAPVNRAIAVAVRQGARGLIQVDKEAVTHVQGDRLNHAIFAREERQAMISETALRSEATQGSYDRRCIMTVAVQQMHPVAHVPWVLGVLRRLEIAPVIDNLLPPHPAHVLSCGRGVEALGLAILDGDHALDKVGRRLEERGLVSLLHPGLTRTALHDDRFGHLLDALFAAHLNRVFGAIALKALEVYAITTPWLHQDTTTIALYGAYEDEPQAPGAPRPAYGHSQDGRHDLKQVLLSLGVSGDGGLPLRLGVRDGKQVTVWRRRSPSRSTSASGLEGVQGIVADRKA